MDEGVVPPTAVQFDRYEHAIADQDLIVPLVSVGHNLGNAAVDDLPAAEYHLHRLAVGVTAYMFDDVILVGGSLADAPDGVAAAHVEMEFTRTRVLPECALSPVSGVSRRIPC